LIKKKIGHRKRTNSVIKERYKLARLIFTKK